MEQNLRLEKELQVSMKQQLEEEVRDAQIEHQRAGEIEREMNELKLKMLIKFDKIKMLEDFYNVSGYSCLSKQGCNPEKQIFLEIEVSEQEMRETAIKVVGRGLNRRQKSEQEEREVRLRAIYRMLVISMAKDKDPRGMFLQIMKALTL